MHDDRRRRAVTRRFLVFVGPAAVIGHRLALEEFWIGRSVFVAGIVDQDDDRHDGGDFSFGVNVGWHTGAGYKSAGEAKLAAERWYAARVLDCLEPADAPRSPC